MNNNRPSFCRIVFWLLVIGGTVAQCYLAAAAPEWPGEGNMAEFNIGLLLPHLQIATTFLVLLVPAWQVGFRGNMKVTQIGLIVLAAFLLFWPLATGNISRLSEEGFEEFQQREYFYTFLLILFVAGSFLLYRTQSKKDRFGFAVLLFGVLAVCWPLCTNTFYNVVNTIAYKLHEKAVACSDRSRITLKLNNDAISASAGKIVTFTGTIRNTGNDTVFINGSVSELKYETLQLKDIFLDNIPNKIGREVSYSKPFFSVSVNADAHPGVYNGIFSAQGGCNNEMLHNLATVPFKVIVTP